VAPVIGLINVRFSNSWIRHRDASRPRGSRCRPDAARPDPAGQYIKPGLPITEQVIFAVKKAVVAGQLKAGQAFPSVRIVSQELKINPNTAHKVVTQLMAEMRSCRCQAGNTGASRRGRLIDR